MKVPSLPNWYVLLIGLSAGFFSSAVWAYNFAEIKPGRIAFVSDIHAARKVGLYAEPFQGSYFAGETLTPRTLTWSEAADTLRADALQQFPKNTALAYRLFAADGVDSTTLRQDVLKYLKTRHRSTWHEIGTLRRIWTARYYDALFHLSSAESGTEPAFFFSYFVIECDGKTRPWLSGNNAGGLYYSKARHPAGFIRGGDHNANGQRIAVRYAKFATLSGFAEDQAQLLTRKCFGGRVWSAMDKIAWCAKGGYHVAKDTGSRRALVGFYKNFEKYFAKTL